MPQHLVQPTLDSLGAHERLYKNYLDLQKAFVECLKTLRFIKKHRPTAAKAHEMACLCLEVAGDK